MKRIARGKHADLPPAMLHHFVSRPVERTRPWPRGAANEWRRQRQMAPPAEHDFGSPDEPPRGRAQTLDALLADADDGQPARRCGSLALDRVRKRHGKSPHPRRYDGGAAIGGTARSTRRP